MNKPFVDKIFTGKVKQLGEPNATNPMDRPWESSIFKMETDEQIWLKKTGLKGDEVADKKNHGGPEKAIFVYPVKHYDYWTALRSKFMFFSLKTEKNTYPHM